jgi:hypothetical protein
VHLARKLRSARYLLFAHGIIDNDEFRRVTDLINKLESELKET